MANRLAGLAIGGVYLLIGILGLLLPFDVLLFGVLSTNVWQDGLHVVIGSALLLAALSGPARAKTANPIIGTVCLLFGLTGLFLVGSDVNVLALNALGNVLHFAAAAVLLAVGLGAETKPTTA